MRSRAQIARLIDTSGLMQRLAAFDPHWVGSTALNVHDEAPDVDLCCSFLPGLEETRAAARAAGESLDGFALTEETYGGKPSRILRFRLDGLKFEAWGRAPPVLEHEFWRFTQVEARLLALHGAPLRHFVRARKALGADTEGAFAAAFGVHTAVRPTLLDWFARDDASLAQLQFSGGSA
ncbi:DUF4269 domain-containing protein [Hyphomonas sp.]|uniref:DUF4269 domain-containing protein n=1 Tax=Hyphomonas sp. TaxID=87 RepID=UPI0025BF8180|nr:DUF4269 domain-containing protein [Hyphomonas sp.]MBI1400144.1 DUF4269 domain-containing protein [Hyphomonas sp.]